MRRPKKINPNPKVTVNAAGDTATVRVGNHTIIVFASEDGGKPEIEVRAHDGILVISPRTANIIDVSVKDFNS